MATQLRRNAHHFSDALVKDKAVMEQLETKVESNFDAVLREGKRLFEQAKKGSSTTWITWGIILTVVVIFAFMVLLIRATRW